MRTGPASVERRRKTNQRTARENVAHLVDDGSFMEYGSLAIAAQRRRRKLDDLIKSTPADGLVMGVADGQRREVRRRGPRAASSWPTTTPCWPARRAT